MFYTLTRWVGGFARCCYYVAMFFAQSWNGSDIVLATSIGFIAVCSVALVVIVVQFPRDVFVGQTQQTSETKF